MCELRVNPDFADGYIGSKLHTGFIRTLNACKMHHPSIKVLHFSAAVPKD